MKVKATNSIILLVGIIIIISVPIPGNRLNFNKDLLSDKLQHGFVH